MEFNQERAFSQDPSSEISKFYTSFQYHWLSIYIHVGDVELYIFLEHCHVRFVHQITVGESQNTSSPCHGEKFGGRVQLNDVYMANSCQLHFFVNWLALEEMKNDEKWFNLLVPPFSWIWKQSTRANKTDRNEMNFEDILSFLLLWAMTRLSRLHALAFNRPPSQHPWLGLNAWVSWNGFILTMLDQSTVYHECI